MRRFLHTSFTALLALALSACATRAVDVQPLPADPADFVLWDCERLDTEGDRVQQRAAELAYAVDQRAGTNIIALGVGLSIFWPALMAMQPAGVDAEELAQLKGRFEALDTAARRRGCSPREAALPASRAATLPVTLGERLVYEERVGVRGPMRELGLRLVALRRDEFEFRVDWNGVDAGAWKQDFAGNVTTAPDGLLLWPRLLRHGVVLGQVVGGEMWLPDDLGVRARVRGQVVAVGPQTVAGRHFDVAVVELFGDAQRGDASTRLDGVIVVDRASGLLLRLDLRSAQPGFALQRRLARVEPAA